MGLYLYIFAFLFPHFNFLLISKATSVYNRLSRLIVISPMSFKDSLRRKSLLLQNCLLQICIPVVTCALSVYLSHFRV